MSAQPASPAARRILARAHTIPTTRLVLALGEPARAAVANHANIDRLARLAADNALEERLATIEKRRAGL